MHVLTERVYFVWSKACVCLLYSQVHVILFSAIAYFDGLKDTENNAIETKVKRTGDPIDIDRVLTISKTMR